MAFYVILDELEDEHDEEDEEDEEDELDDEKYSYFVPVKPSPNPTPVLVV